MDIEISPEELELIENIEKYYPNIIEYSTDELKFGKLSKKANDLILFLKELSYVSILKRVIDAYLFLYLIDINKIKNINIPELCNTRNRIKNIYKKLILKYNKKSYYKNIPNKNFYNYLETNCDKHIIFNISLILGGLALIYEGIRNLN